jgi:hypothetical protein
MSRSGGCILEGIVYLHSMSDSKAFNSTMKDIKDLSRYLPARSFVIGTTMWDCISLDTGTRYEKELKEDESLLKDSHDAGVEFFRHSGKDDRNSAHTILRCLLNEPHLVA